MYEMRGGLHYRPRVALLFPKATEQLADCGDRRRFYRPNWLFAQSARRPCRSDCLGGGGRPLVASRSPGECAYAVGRLHPARNFNFD